MDFKDYTVEKFAELTASDAPAPGGGSVAALTGALGAALAEMVANLTVGKEKYAEVDEEMQRLSEEGAAIRRDLINAIRKDSASFTAYMTALRMPKNTEEEKALRREAMQSGLKEAAEVPLEIAECAEKIFPIAELAVKHGNKNAVTDGLISAMIARTAVLAALLNVKINLDSIRDEAFVTEMTGRVKALEENAIAKEKEILAACKVSESMAGRSNLQ